jgi:hypothetical protein
MKKFLAKKRKEQKPDLILIFKDKHHSIFNYSRTWGFFFWPSVNSKRIEKEVILEMFSHQK